MSELQPHPSVREVARRMRALEEGLKRAVRSPQLTRSSIDNGALNVRDADGQLTGIIGKQWDGTTGYATVAGPTPPAPAGITLTALPSAIKVEWDGTFEGGAVAPMDWARGEVRLSASVDMDGLSQPIAAEFTSAAGGEATIHALTPGVAVYVRVTTRATSGKYAVSDTYGPVTPGQWAADAIDVDFESFAGTRIHYGTDEPTTESADLWMEETAPGPPPQYVLQRYNPLAEEWQPVADQGAADAALLAEAAQTAAELRARLFAQDTAPVSGVDFDPADKVLWIDTDGGHASYTWDGDSFEPRLIGNAAIEPASLVASDVLVTGTVSAALLEALLVLSTTVVAGDPDGTHAELSQYGLRIFREDPIDNEPNEVIRLGTLDPGSGLPTNDYFGIAGDDGSLLASIDETGQINARTANFRDDITVQGRSLAAQLAETSEGQVGKWSGLIPGLDGANGIRAEYGICDFTLPVEAGRSYLIRFDGPAFATTDATPGSATGGEVYLRVRAALDAAVALTSPELRLWTLSGFPDGRIQIPNRSFVYDATTSGVLDVGLTLQLGTPPLTTSVVKVSSSNPVYIEAYDMGPTLPGTAGQANAMGGQLHGGPPPAPPPPAVVQYNTGWMAPAGWRTFSGSGVERTGSVAGPIQGWDPSGTNGDGAGFWWWDFSGISITGTVDEVWVWLESQHTYYNSGGVARINIIKGGAGYPVTSSMLTAGMDVAGFPKPGSKQVDISGWGAYFRDAEGANRAIGVSVGPRGSTDLNYYIRFGGSSARLLIKYTQ